MASCSLGLLIFLLFVNEFRNYIGFAKGYAPHNFAFNIGFFLPSTFLSMALGIATIGRTIKHWNSWSNLKKKWIFIGLSLPGIIFWVYIFIK
tara:strand:+ start:2058 stop:2333 length:276 start_codon:yes stop_codon:yes gene_type:complete